MTATATDLSLPGRAERPLLDRLADWTIAPRGPAFRWSFVAAALLAATVARFLLDPYLPAGFPFLTFFPAVALVAFFAGTLPGAVLAACCFLTAWFFFVPPFWSFAISAPSALAMVLYLVVTGIELGLVHLMRRALRRLQATEAAAREIARSRTLMFAELQHRVSNNLAVVGSLLSLQRREVSDPTAIRALDGAVARLNVVSRLSRLLHDPEAQEIDFGGFLRAMVPDAVAAAGVEERVRVTVSAEPVVVPAERAVPLGLIATELLTNAMEHGFPDGRSGRVRVSLEKRGDRARLTVRDDGAGLPPGWDIAKARSLGITIARQFAGQMDAELSITEEGGVVSRLDVPLTQGA